MAELIVSIFFTFLLQQGLEEMPIALRPAIEVWFQFLLRPLDKLLILSGFGDFFFFFFNISDEKVWALVIIKNHSKL